jgi:hypothetical protein
MPAKPLIDHFLPVDFQGGSAQAPERLILTWIIPLPTEASYRADMVVRRKFAWRPEAFLEEPVEVVADVAATGIGRVFARLRRPS